MSMKLLSDIRISFGALVIAGAVLLAGCGSSGPSGPTNFGSPQHAAAVTTIGLMYASIGSAYAGAPAPVVNALKSLNYDGATKAPSLVPGAENIIKLAPGAPGPYGAPVLCDISGNVSSSGDASNGSVTFNSCIYNLGPPLTLTINMTVSWATSASTVSVTMDGTMAMSDGSQTVTIGYSSFTVSMTDEGGDNSSSTIDGTISISGTGSCYDGTFVFTTTTPIWFDDGFGDTTDGEVQVNNATITYNADGSVTLTVGGQSIDPTGVINCPV